LQIALAVTPLLILPLMMFGGFFLNNGSAPVYFAWIQWISPIKYGFASLAKNQLSGMLIGGQPLGSEQLRNLSLDGGFPIFANIAMLFVLYVAVTLLAFLSLFRLVNSLSGKKLLTRKELKNQLLRESTNNKINHKQMH
ncbi:hypothetical protein K7432_010266, partial [Basidiobolus ranarum]